MAYIRIAKALEGYNALDDDMRSKTTLSQYIKNGPDVQEYLADHAKYQEIDVSLDDWLASDEEARAKDRRQAERIYRMKNEAS